MSYLFSEKFNEIEKAATSGNCNHISGDDTDANGYRLVVVEDAECDCYNVRAIAPGDNMNISVSNNILTLNSAAVVQKVRGSITGGGQITATILGEFSTGITWSYALKVSLEDSTSILIPPLSVLTDFRIPVFFSTDGRYKL